MGAAPRPFSAVYLAAGLSSRFGGRVKCLQEVGRHGETLLELSVRQLQQAHSSLAALVLIVSDESYAPIRALVGDDFLGLPVSWCFQRTPAWRMKPFGTVDALLAAEDAVHGPFIVLNGDSLYGVNALRLVCEHVATRDEPCMPGYKLRDVLPARGKVNRAVISVDGDGCLERIVEQYGIGVCDIRAGRYTGDELTSMNIFGLQPDIFDFARRKQREFLDYLASLYDGDAPPGVGEEQACELAVAKEYILSTMLNALRPESGVRTRVLTSESIRTPLELTNPDDLAFVKTNLDRVGL